MDLVKQKRLAVLCAMTSALVWGLMWFPFRHMAEAGVSTATTSLMVYLVSIALGGVVFFDTYRRQLRFERVLVPLTLLYGWCNFSYTWAVSEGQVMRVLLLFYLSPLWTVFFSSLLLHERLTRRGWQVVAMSLTGCAVILYRPGLFDGALPLSTRAEWLALSGGVAFALGNVISRQAQGLPVPVKSASVWLGVAGFGLGALLVRGDLAEIGAVSGWQWLVLLALGATLLATSVISMHGLTILPATQVMTLMLMELVFAALSAYFLAGERMSLSEWAGGALIGGASLLSGGMTEKRRPTVPAPAPPAA
ncbi:DMT family transporter [Gulbenkiania mobilis]|uniref:DMT family transporter n=1 Tax=Gulbenkiania mobilis TaxID=397457 RepID=UPI0010443ACE